MRLLWWIYRRAMGHIFIGVFVFVTSLVVTVRHALLKHKQNGKNNNDLLSGKQERYTADMRFFVSATPAPKPRVQSVIVMSLFYAALLAIMAVAQLFTFEDFIQHIVTLDLPGGRGAAHFIAALIIVSEILALPFLLRMALSPAFRWVSLAFGWLVAGLWIYVSTWTVLFVPEASTIGFMGTVIEMIPGWWAVFISISFGILAAWATYGMAPVTRKKKSKR